VALSAGIALKDEFRPGERFGSDHGEFRPSERLASDHIERVRLPLAALAQDDPHTLDLLRRWEDLRQGGLLPLKTDLDPLALKPFLGRVHIVETTAENPENYFFRLWASDVRFDGGSDYTSLHLRDYPHAPYRKAVMQDYWDAVNSGVPAYHRVFAINDSRLYEYARLILPFSKDGTAVSHLLVHVRNLRRPALVAT
jgi:hypothetical protein